MQGSYNVLFLCTGNSARSIRGRGHSQLQRPTKLQSLQRGQSSVRKRSTGGAASAGDRAYSDSGIAQQTLGRVLATGSPELHFVFTVCDNAAKEVCPVWPGQPKTTHWGIPDPAAVRGSAEEIERAFREAFLLLDRRISLFLCLPLGSLDRLALKKELDNIGQTTTPTHSGQ